jgi:uncharacterized membrane protein
MMSGGQGRGSGFRRVFGTRAATSGLLFGIGMAAFVDEVVFHQLLHWHHFYDKSTTDAGLDLLAYDLTWNSVGALMVVVGLALIATTARRSPARARADSGPAAGA